MKFIRGNLAYAQRHPAGPYGDKMVHHPDFARFWSAAEDLDLAMPSRRRWRFGRQIGSDRFDARPPIVAHTMEMMMAAASVIWGGVCERHPRIKIGFM